VTLVFKYLPVAAVFLYASQTLSQPALRFSHLSIRHGLSQGAVNCIFQDRQGFMWFGTQDGLNRFNGYSFTVFKRDPDNPNSLNGGFIASIHEDVHGILWIATLDNPSKLNKFDRLTETFSHHPVDSVDLRGAAVSSVFASCVDLVGNKWSGSIGGGVTFVDSKTGARTIYKHVPGDSKSLIDNKVYSVYGDRSGTVWVGTHEGLDRFDPATKGFIHYTHNDRDPSSLSDSWVWPIHEDRNGTLWVGTVRGGLNRFDRTTGKFFSYKHDAANPASLNDDYVLSIYEDKAGVIWVGTNTDGLSFFHPSLNPFTNFSNDPSNKRSLSDNNITSVFVDRHGVPWIGTRGGLGRFDRESNGFTHFVHDPRNAGSLGENATPSMCEDRDGNLWIGTYSSGLDRFDRKTNSFKHHRRDPSTPSSLTDNRIYALLEDRDGILWVGTYGGGLNRFDPSTERFTPFTRNDSIPGNLSENGVWALCEDRDGVLWVGTSGGGLNRFDKRSGKFTASKHDAKNPQSISDDNVLCILEDKAGMLWIGTTGGLNKFDRASGVFRAFRVKDGLPNDFVFGILEDGKGNLWMSTNKGIARFDPKTETFRTYDASDGLQGNEFNQNAYGKDRVTGELYFGGVNGVTRFHPDSIRDNPFVPPVVFSAFRRYNTDDKEGEPIEEQGISVRPNVALTYKDNIATFEFAALNYYNAFKNRYAYQLEGFSDNWIQLGTEHRATFTNLDPGDYVLKVKGSNNDGVWNEAGASLAITVTPPWWKTRWAYGTYAVLFLSALYGLRQAENNRREQKARVRESELRAKAAEAEKRALSIENERKTKELEEARALQLSMLPQEIPKLPHLEIAVFMKTSTEVGGDYYDFQLQPDGTLAIGFGDATGHGMQAGTIVTLMKGMFTSDVSRLEIPAFFNHCSKSIKGIRLGRLLMSFTLLKINGNKISFSCAGMPPVFLYRKASESVDEILLKGMPLGAMKSAQYSVQEETLQPGDTLLLLTDGLPEQKNREGEMFDYKRVQSTFQNAIGRPPDEIIKNLIASGESWMGDAVQDDDITLMAITMRG